MSCNSNNENVTSDYVENKNETIIKSIQDNIDLSKQKPYKRPKQKEIKNFKFKKNKEK